MRGRELDPHWRPASQTTPGTSNAHPVPAGGPSEIHDRVPEVRLGAVGTVFDHLDAIFSANSLDVGLPVGVLQ